MNGLVAAVYASIFLAIGEATLKRSYRDFAPSVAYFISAIIGLVIWLPIALIFGASFSNFWQVLPFAIGSAILSEAFYFYALSKGQLSITAIILSSYPIYTILFSFLINGERLTSLQALFVGITIAGTLISYLPSKLSREELKKSQAILWPLLAAIAVGLSDTISKTSINDTSAYDFLLAFAIIQPIVGIAYLRLEKESPLQNIRQAISSPLDYLHSFMGALFTVIGTGLMWVAFNDNLASLVSPITATSGAFIIIFAVLFMDEKTKLRNVIGIVLVFIGVLGISAI